MNEKLLAFAMVLTRVSAFFLVSPIFSWKTIPRRIKAAMAVLISIFFSLVFSPQRLCESGKAAEAVLLLCNEAIYGFALGLIAAMVFAAVRLSGRIIERQMGLAMAEILDPLTGERAQPLGMFFEIVFIVLLLSANGHHLLLQVLWHSYESFPPGRTPTLASLTNGVVSASSTLLVAGLRLAAPILAAFLLLMVTLAVLARIAQEMNILFISLPLRVGLGLMMAVALYLPFVSSFVSEFADWMGKLLPL